MSPRVRDAIFLVGLSAVATMAAAQNVYKCGNTYSQTPCPGGTPMAVEDERTAAQKAQSQAVAKQDAKTAEAQQKARLAQEKADLAANRPQAPASKASASRPATGKNVKPAGDFTADVPPDKADKASARKKRKAAPAKKKSPTANQPVRK